MQYNYNKTYDAAEIVQWGPAYCPKGSKITASGIPSNCTNMDVLKKDCKKEIITKLIIDPTMKLASSLVGARRRRLAMGDSGSVSSVCLNFTPIHVITFTLTSFSLKGSSWSRL